jgi:hypothetical protein
MDWIDLAQDRRRALINAVINLSGCIICGKFLDSLRTCELRRKDCYMALVILSL